MIVEKNAKPKIVKVMQNIIYDAFPSDMPLNVKYRKLVGFLNAQYYQYSMKMINTIQSSVSRTWNHISKTYCCHGDETIIEGIEEVPFSFKTSEHK